MQKSKLVILAGAAALAMSVTLFTACNKNKNNGTSGNSGSMTGTVDGDYAYDQALAEKILDDAVEIANRAQAAGGGSGAFKTSGCAAVTVVPGKVTVEFGPVNCLCSDGRNRRGRIEVTYTGNYKDSGSVHTMTFSSYCQNEIKVEGFIKETVMGNNIYGEGYSKSHAEITLRKDDNTVVSLNWDRSRAQAAGSQTPLNIWDDVYAVTGSGNITRSGGTVNFDIIKPLEIHNDCRWIEKGLIAFTLNTGEQRTLNYGDGSSCDPDAAVTSPDGTNNVIKLP